MKYKHNILIYYILITIISIFICIISYIKFNINISNVNNEIRLSNLNSDIKVEYYNTSNVSMVNYLAGDTLIKNFDIYNTGETDLYYDIKLIDVVNNFEDTSDLKYTLISDNAAYVKEKDCPINDEFIASNVYIKKGEKHSYTLEINFIKKDSDQSNNLYKTFSSSLSVINSISNNSYNENSLFEMIKDSSLGVENLDEYSDGVYYTNSSINSNTIYFYRGSNNLNNNVVFGNKCYKIIRTTSDNGVRIIYNGEFENNICSDTTSINKLNFNSNSSYNTYVGYMYGYVNSSDYKNEHSNVSSSDIKILLDSWYETNIKKYSNYISNDTIYCGNRKTSSFKYKGISYNILGYSSNNTGYKVFSDLLDNKNISLDCNNINDMYSVNSGNKKLVNSIGLITAEELYYAGYNNSNNYLSTNYDYWTMTPAYYNSSGAYNIIASKNKLIPALVTKEYSVRPVITINGNIEIISGDGSNINPYILSK